MSKVNRNYDDFSLKLCQRSAIETLRKYILWQRGGSNFQEAPISINLDITSACNYACPYCVDKKVLNTGDSFTVEELYDTIWLLSRKGLKSILLIGGGEPLLHPYFEAIVHCIKHHNLQLGIVTNGSEISKLMRIADCLGEKDWIRFSLDAGTEKTFQAIHEPRKRISLAEICSAVKSLKLLNDKISIGFAYIIFYEGIVVDGIQLTENVDEIPMAVELAIQNDFDYINFKPCLIKSGPTSNRESLLYRESEERIKRITYGIREKLSEAKEAYSGRITIHESINLQAMFRDDLSSFKRQPNNCHCQVFRQIVTPLGIYHCPAFRGDPKAFIAPKEGYMSYQNYEETLINNLELMSRFDASKECKDIVCFYNRLNWWIEDFINSGRDVNSIEAVPDENFFL